MMDFNRDNIHNCPCMECPRQGCGSYHDICPHYKRWREKLDRQNENERQFHKNNDTMSDAKKKASWRSKRYSRQTAYRKSTKAE